MAKTTTWTFSRQLAAGLGAQALLTVGLAVLAILALLAVIEAKDDVIRRHATLVAEAYRLEGTAFERMGTVRAFVLTGDPRLPHEIEELRDEFFAQLAGVRELVETPTERAVVEAIAADAKVQFDSGDGVVAMRTADASLAEVGQAFQDRVLPLNRVLRERLTQLVLLQKEAFTAADEHAADTAQTAITLVLGVAGLSILLAVSLIVVLNRVLGRQIGSAVGQIRSSASELQAAANQQTAGAREQVSAMTQISTTIKELLATARQIAEGAQGVARLAEDTTAASQQGDDTVRRAQADVSAIRRQVDVVVEHMLDLGRKSQQIGGILEIIDELAEQTNILAINATIEAAGAGDAGRRFAVVADEIRRLADRVGGSTREIRELTDEIRAAINAAVLATESGSKAVDAGNRQFAEVTAVFLRIGELLRGTATVAKEIELSTKQQSTAVEQVNVATASVAQAARDAEAGYGQVLQTVSELTTLSRELSRLVVRDGDA